MDANHIRFHLLLGESDWGACTFDKEGMLPLITTWAPSADRQGLDWDEDQHAVTLEKRLFQFVTSPMDVAPALALRRGAGRDRYGNWYWIGQAQRDILVTSSGTSVTAHFWRAGDGVVCDQHAGGDFEPVTPPPPIQALDLSALTVTEDHYLVVGVQQPAGLLIFDLHAGGPPIQIYWPDPEQVPFVPFDMAPRPGGGVFILDRVNKCYWILDRQFNVLRQGQEHATLGDEVIDDFQPHDLADDSQRRRTSARTFPKGITLEAAVPLEVHDPIAIEAVRDGKVLILDNSVPHSRIYCYDVERSVEVTIVNAVLGGSVTGNTLGFRGYDLAFVPGHRDLDERAEDVLFVVAASGNQAIAFAITQEHDGCSLEALPRYFPMRLFQGKGLVRAAEQAFYDFGDRWIPLIEQRRAQRYVEEATLFTPINLERTSDDLDEEGGAPHSAARHAFDGRDPGCVWHRLLLDACIPLDTSVQIWSRAANDEQALAAATWLKEPGLYLRGDSSEQPYVRKSKVEGDGTWELLFQRARGRFLQLKLVLSGNGRSTPRLRALRAYYPRFSYVERYLPAVYREDGDSAWFLDRFLANLEGLYTTLEDKIAAVQLLFDVRSAPPETLAWLAHWLGVALDPAWDEARQRLFIQHAMLFFQYRGTMRGIQMALRIALDECPDEAVFVNPEGSSTIRITEKYRTRRTPAVVIGDPTAPIGPRLVAKTERWRPAQGGAVLHARYAEFWNIQQAKPFPIKDPPADDSAGWQQFAQETLGFVPSSTPADLKRSQEFLARRYRRIAALNEAYRLSGAQALSSFDDVQLPDQLPGDGTPLLDWFHFEAVVLPMHRAAHRFSVLLPVAASQDLAQQQRRLNIAQRIVDLQKPAHTVFDVKLYWALFRVGEARLGIDTLIDVGSRAPQLMTPMVIGQGYLAESYLAPAHPFDVSERRVVGRDRVE